MPGVGGGRRDEDQLARIEDTRAAGVDADDGVTERLRPDEDHFGKLHAPRDLPHRHGGIERQAKIVARSLLENEARLGLLQRAERQNARQQSRRTAESARKFVRERARGASRRHKDRRLSQRERPERMRKPLDDATLEKGGRKGF